MTRDDGRIRSKQRCHVFDCMNTLAQLAEVRVAYCRRMKSLRTRSDMVLLVLSSSSASVSRVKARDDQLEDAVSIKVSSASTLPSTDALSRAVRP